MERGAQRFPPLFCETRSDLIIFYQVSSTTKETMSNTSRAKNIRTKKDVEESEIEELTKFSDLKIEDEEKSRLVLYRGLRTSAENMALRKDSIVWSHFLHFVSVAANPFVVYCELVAIMKKLNSEVIPTPMYISFTNKSKESNQRNMSKLQFMIQRQKNSLENFLLELCYCVLLAISNDQGEIFSESLKKKASQLKESTHNYLNEVLQGTFPLQFAVLFTRYLP